MTRLENVNTVDVRDAVQLGCHAMTRGFNPHDADRPFFSACIRPTACLGWSNFYSDAHVPGRHLNALVAARKYMNVDIDEEAIKKHADALFFSYSGEIPLPLNRASITARKPSVFLAHNLREGFHGLNALMWGYENNKAFELTQQSIAFIQRNWHPRNGWQIQESPSGFNPNHLISGIGRAIGPLVKIYRSTQYEPALDLAQDIAEAATDSFPMDGEFLGDGLGHHVHSITSTLSSLAQLAEITNDTALLRRVEAFYNRGLWEIRDELGWAIESMRPTANADRGEVNTSGDILETALIVGAHLDASYYGDAERILRCHILPSQLRDISFTHGPSSGESSPSSQGFVSERLIGAWGFPAPYGHEPIGLPSVRFNLDIVGGTVGSLCEFYRSAVTYEQVEGYKVHCLLDIDESIAQVRSPYMQDQLTIRLNEPGHLAIRAPNWFEEDPATFAVSKNLRYEDGYWHRDQAVDVQPLELQLRLTKQTVVLRHRTRDIMVNMEGDSVVSMENHGADLTFFDSLNE